MGFPACKSTLTGKPAKIHGWQKMKIILENVTRPQFNRIVDYVENKYYQPSGSEKWIPVIEIGSCETIRGSRPLVYKSIEMNVTDTSGNESVDQSIKKSTRGLMNVIMAKGR